MAASSNSRSCVSLFDKELNYLLRDARVITKDFGHGTGNGEQLELLNKGHNHEKGNV